MAETEHVPRAAERAGGEHNKPAVASKATHAAADTMATPAGSRSERAASAREEERERAGAFPGGVVGLMRRVYDREQGWYKDAPLAAAALYALGVLGPLLMLASLAYALRFTHVKATSEHLWHIWKVTIGDPRPWSTLAVMDSIVGVSFMNAWIAFREKRVARRAAWVGVNYLLGTMSAWCVRVRG
jgi:hypothetical protein